LEFSYLSVIGSNAVTNHKSIITNKKHEVKKKG